MSTRQLVPPPSFPVQNRDTIIVCSLSFLDRRFSGATAWHAPRALTEKSIRRSLQRGFGVPHGGVCIQPQTLSTTPDTTFVGCCGHCRSIPRLILFGHIVRICVYPSLRMSLVRTLTSTGAKQYHWPTHGASMPGPLGAGTHPPYSIVGMFSLGGELSGAWCPKSPADALSLPALSASAFLGQETHDMAWHPYSVTLLCRFESSTSQKYTFINGMVATTTTTSTSSRSSKY